MTREEQAKKLLPIIQAIADGKELQFSFNGKTWIDETDKLELKTIVDDICTDSCDYRIKSEENPCGECIDSDKEIDCGKCDFQKKLEGTITIEQNVGENRIEGGVLSLSVAPKELNKHCKWCKGKSCNCGTCLNKDEENSYYLLHKEKFPEPQERTFRPFKNCDELCKYWHDEKARTSTFNNSKSLIWVKHKEYGTDNLIVAFDNDDESIGGSCVMIQDIWVDMKELFDNFTFLDGSPCGILEE